MLQLPSLEHLIHNEAEGRLVKAYDSVHVDQTAKLNTTEVETVVDAYMKFDLLSDELAQELLDDK